MSAVGYQRPPTVRGGEFFISSPALGGDAAREMLVRYGWPAFMLYVDVVQTSAGRAIADAGLASSGPYVMPGYHRSRVHTTPTWRALVSPMSSRIGDWTLHEPDTNRVDADPADPVIRDSDEGFQRLRLEREQLSLVWPHSVVWWPSEHFDPRRPLVPSGALQMAQLRRSDGVLVAMATVANDPLAHEDAALGYSTVTVKRRSTDSLRVTIVGSKDTLSPVVFASSAVAVGRKVVLQTPMPAGQYVLGLESRTLSPAGADSRVRFRFTSARPLSELAPTEIAISDPIVLDTARDAVVRAEADDVTMMLKRMKASSLIQRGVPFDLLWEVYGVARSDTVHVEVRVMKDGRTGALYQLIRKLGLQSAIADSMMVRWRAVDTRQSSSAAPSRATDIGIGQLRLNLSQQTSGWHTIETSVTRSPGQRAVGRRRIRIVE